MAGGTLFDRLMLFDVLGVKSLFGMAVKTVLSALSLLARIVMARDAGLQHAMIVVVDQRFQFGMALHAITAAGDQYLLQTKTDDPTQYKGFSFHRSTSKDLCHYNESMLTAHKWACR